MQNLPASPGYSHLSVWGFAVGFAASALFLGVIMWPAGMMMHGAWGSNPMMGQGAHPMMGYGSGYGWWHTGGLLLGAIIAGVAGAIIAAVHNALVPKT